MNKLFDFVVVVLIGLAIYSWASGPDTPDVPDVPDNPDIPVVTKFVAPTGKFAAVPDVSSYVSGTTALELAWFWKNFAKQIDKDTYITNVRMARNLHAYAGKILRTSASEDLYNPELSVRLETFFASMLGTDVKKITSEVRRDIVDSFNAIAWAHYKASLLRQSPEDAISWIGSPNITHGCIMASDQLPQYIKDLTDMGIKPSLIMGAEKPPGPPDSDEIRNGLIIDEQRNSLFIESIPKFNQYGFGGMGEGKTRLLYESVLKFDPKAFTEAQHTSDCTSHAARNAADCSRAFEIAVQGESEDFVTRGATEPIYGMRGHASGGMMVSTAAKFLNQTGGIALRKNYGIVDLSVYSPDLAIRWGRMSGGTPSELRDELKRNQVEVVSLIQSAEEARDAIFSGYGIIVGSGFSFSSTRDVYGFARRTPQGWRHAMAWVATAPAGDLMDSSQLEQYMSGEYSPYIESETYAEYFDGEVDLPKDWPELGDNVLDRPSPVRSADDPCFLIANSWGKWNGGPKGKYDIPDGSFWITKELAEGMIRQRQALAVGNCQGFKPLPLDDWGFTPWLGTADPAMRYEPDTFVPTISP